MSSQGTLWWGALCRGSEDTVQGEGGPVLDSVKAVREEAQSRRELV